MRTSRASSGRLRSSVRKRDMTPSLDVAPRNSFEEQA
jgi:hypothetical protein